jgi:hypothetical protein
MSKSASIAFSRALSAASVNLEGRSAGSGLELFRRDRASLRVGMKLHFLTILDAFTLPSTVVGFKFW